MDKIYVTRSSMPFLEEYVEEIKPLWDTHWLTNMGVKHKQFQRELKEYLGVEQVELLVNGHMALELTLQAMGLKGEVITTPFTFASTTHAIVRNGLKPVFCDIDPGTYTIDATKIKRLITKDTCAIMPVHVYGNICKIEEIEKIAKEYGLKVIYDAAHTFGESYKGKGIGTFGDASVFSFHATKVFNSIEGGAVCFKDKGLVQALDDLKNFGIHGKEEVDAVGTNAKMNEFCASMGICNLRHVDDEIKKRSKVAKRYRELLESSKGLQLNRIQKGVKSNYAYFPVVFQDAFGAGRDEVFQKLAENNIYTRKYFYPLTKDFSCYTEFFDRNETPVALDISKRVLILPMYADLSIENIDRICEIILSCQKRKVNVTVQKQSELLQVNEGIGVAMKKLFSIILPVYKNEENLPITVPYIIENLGFFPAYNVEIIMVNDGSPDHSWDLMKEYQAQYPNLIRIASLTRNFGQSAATRCGIDMAKGDVIGVISADLQDPFELFAEMLAAWEDGNKLVMAVREGRREKGPIVFCSKLFHRFVNKHVNPDYPIGGFDFFLMDREVADRYKKLDKVSSSLQLLLLWMGYEHREIKYTRKSRKIGTSGYSVSAKMDLAIRVVVSWSNYPIKVILFTGAALMAAGLVLGAGGILLYLSIRAKALILWEIIFVLFILSGAVLTAVGIIGEYIWHLFELSKHYPRYIVKEEIEEISVPDSSML